MRTYYVVNGSVSFGFGGFIKKAFTTKEQAEEFVSTLRKKYRNLTECEVSEVQAKNKKEAEANRPSMYAGVFAGADAING